MCYMNGHANANGSTALRKYYAQFPIDECRITEFSGNGHTHLNVMLRERGIRRGRPVPWPSRFIEPR
ncbi:hypothetical protein TNCV_898551 [Trichonephila clavipes]|nr:hypothetical protein TNCV_898551 [Trichonephila clavipes]